MLWYCNMDGNSSSNKLHSRAICTALCKTLSHLLQVSTFYLFPFLSLGIEVFSVAEDFWSYYSDTILRLICSKFLVLEQCVLCCSHFSVITDLFFRGQGKKPSQKQNQRIPLKLLFALETFYSKTKYWLPRNNLWKKLKADFFSLYTVLNNVREDLIFPLFYFS